MNMKVMNITDLEKFFEVINQCDESIELVTETGDIYNLKSKLNQYGSFAKVFFGNTIPVLELITHNSSDTGKIIHYMMHNK